MQRIYRLGRPGEACVLAAIFGNKTGCAVSVNTLGAREIPHSLVATKTGTWTTKTTLKHSP